MRMIEISDVWCDIKKHLKLYYIILPIAFIVSLIYALGQINLYSCEVVLSPEITPDSRSKLFQFLKLVEGGYSINEERDWFAPPIYPEIVKSSAFKERLLSVKIKPFVSQDEMTYHYYLANYQKVTWWKTLFNDVSRQDPPHINTYKPSYNEYMLLEGLTGLVKCSVDPKTLIITVKVTDQNPEVCALIADSARVLLQEQIETHYSQKAAIDMEYNKKIANQKRESYLKAAKDFSDYADSNREATLLKTKTQLNYLEQEMNLQYNAYSNTLGQVIASEARVQEAKPAFTILKSATVPTDHNWPNRAKMVIMFVIYVFYMITCYVLYKEKFWRRNVCLKI